MSHPQSVKKTKRCSQNMQFRPCPTPTDYKRIACSASNEAEISSINQNEANFHKSLKTTIIPPPDRPR
jgi:hypothetical protein